MVNKILTFSFFALFFLVPLVMSNTTSEVFEFNKMVVIYLLAIIIFTAWAARMIIEKRVIFRRTLLDLPLLVFLASQFISLLFSIDQHTSFWGYYSRWNGGFLSSLVFALLYWAFVSNMTQRFTLYALRFLLISALLVSLWGIPAHFGFDPTCAVFGYGLNVDCWTEQFVPTARIFSTLGQANWLAAFLVATMPLAWAQLMNANLGEFKTNAPIRSFASIRILKFASYSLLGTLMFLALLYTNSRSGFLGFLAALAIFWAGAFWLKRKAIKTLLGPFLILNSSFLILVAIIGSPFTPPLRQFIAQPPVTNHKSPVTGITPSTDIRKIVWRGAIDVWKAYPILGTGPETFAYSYYNFRPREHNLTSEWDFLYNKAHNEFLNYLANTGIIGLGAYLLLIGTFILWGGKTILGYYDIPKNSQYRYIAVSLLAGYISILVTNFFGFSVFPVQLLFFLYPAMAVNLESGIGNKELGKNEEFSTSQKLLILATLIPAAYFLIQIGRFYLADMRYSQAEKLADAGQYAQALPQIQAAVSIWPAEPVYLDELANIASSLSQQFAETDQTTTAAQFAQTATQASDRVLLISPRHLNFLKSRSTMFWRLSAVDPSYLGQARKTLEVARQLAPTDAKTAYNLGLAHARLAELDEAIKVLKETVELKSDYRDARYALALFLAEKGQRDEAIGQLRYILEKINPQDLEVKEKLEDLEK